MSERGTVYQFIVPDEIAATAVKEADFEAIVQSLCEGVLVFHGRLPQVHQSRRHGDLRFQV